MTFFLIVWCVIAIPMVSLVDGGFIGALFIGGGRGFVIGAASTASVLYGQIIWCAFSYAHS
jgi:hypothetical protein